MRPEISEFSFGFALAQEMIQNLAMPLRAAPLFPSLYAEGSSGFDLKLDRSKPMKPLYLQFKLSHCMSRNNCREIRRLNLFPRNTIFYRMFLRSSRYSNQHQLLINLESNGGEVYYAAPAFHLPTELDSAYFNSNVRKSTIFIKPSFIGQLTDDLDHYVAFEPSGNRYFLSEPRSIKEDISWHSFMNYLAEMLSAQPIIEFEELLSIESDILTNILAQYVDNYQGKMRLEYENAIHNLGNYKSKYDSITYVSYVARTFFECEPFILGYSEE